MIRTSWAPIAMVKAFECSDPIWTPAGRQMLRLMLLGVFSIIAKPQLTFVLFATGPCEGSFTFVCFDCYAAAVPQVKTCNFNFSSALMYTHTHTQALSVSPN